MGLLSLSNVALLLAALFLARRVYWETTTGSRQRALKRQHGCLPPKKLVFWDPILGLDHVIGNFKAYSQHALLERWMRGVTRHGTHTIRMKILGQNVFLTDDPENVKSMLATNFDHWSLGRSRIEQMSAYLGMGIFTTEGAAWKHSREMLRPCFERSQVADISIMKKHTDRLINLIPKDGSTVDLQPLFHQLTLDVATEFLFGQSTNSLDTTRDHKEVEEFVDAFEYCQNPFANENNQKWGFLGTLLPDWKLKTCIKVIKGTCKCL